MTQPIRTVDEYGIILYKLNGRYHRVDGPARIWSNGTQEWCQHGRLHRTDGPAITYPDGYQAWYRHGELHRVDGPAVIWADGEEFWLNGEQVDIMVHFLQRP